MSINSSLSCLSDGDNGNVHQLKVEEKLHLGQQLASGATTVKSCITNYKLRKRTLYKYKLKVKNSLRIRERNGRPPAIDENVQLGIINQLREQPNMPEVDLRKLIREKHQECWEKRNNHKENIKYKRISVQTVTRYSRNYHLLIQPVPDFC